MCSFRHLLDHSLVPTPYPLPPSHPNPNNNKQGDLRHKPCSKAAEERETQALVREVRAAGAAPRREQQRAEKQEERAAASAKRKAKDTAQPFRALDANRQLIGNFATAVEAAVAFARAAGPPPAVVSDAHSSSPPAQDPNVVATEAEGLAMATPPPVSEVDGLELHLSANSATGYQVRLERILNESTATDRRL